MIKIIKEPPKEYVETCSQCGCTFSYEFSDTVVSVLGYSRSVKCPRCDNVILHKPSEYAGLSDYYDNREPIRNECKSDEPVCDHVWKGYINYDQIRERFSYHRRCQNCGLVESYEDTTTNTTTNTTARME